MNTLAKFKSFMKDVREECIKMLIQEVDPEIKMINDILDILTDAEDEGFSVFSDKLGTKNTITIRYLPGSSIEKSILFKIKPTGAEIDLNKESLSDIREIIEIICMDGCYGRISILSHIEEESKSKTELPKILSKIKNLYPMIEGEIFPVAIAIKFNRSDIK